MVDVETQHIIYLKQQMHLVQQTKNTFKIILNAVKQLFVFEIVLLEISLFITVDSLKNNNNFYI